MQLPIALALVPMLAQAATFGPTPPHRTPDRAPSPYDFSAAHALLTAELPDLSQRVAVIVRQGERDIFRFQHGAIDFDTRTRMASLTKTVSAAVMLSVIEDGLLSLDETLGDSFPVLFQQPGIGDATVLDTWSMRHGIATPEGYQHQSLYNHQQSVLQIGLNGIRIFPAGEQLGYNGNAMQVSGYIATLRTGLPWESLAQERILGPLGMDSTDYLQFTPNPGVPGGMRSTALDLMRFAQMMLQEGASDGVQVLQPDSVEHLFSNYTRDLPVQQTPFPPFNTNYPYGADPDYGFGGWVMAEDPATLHVEEIVGAGAWGSYIWIDRRRNLSAVLVTNIASGTQASTPAALGLFAEARDAVEERQVQDLGATQSGADVNLSWTAPTGARTVRVVGSDAPIQNIFDLRRAEFLGTSRSGHLIVPYYPYYATTAVLPELHNSALIPGGNSIGLR